MQRRLLLLAALIPLWFPAAPVAAQALIPGDILIIDQDYDPTPADPSDGFGAILHVDPTLPPDSNTTVLARSDLFYLLQDITVTTTDEVYLVDSGADPLGLGPDPNNQGSNSFGAIFRWTPSQGTVGLVTAGTDYPAGIPGGLPSIFVTPIAIAFAPDGDLILADADADPSGFGDDIFGFAGRGAVFRVEAGTGRVLLLSDGSDYRSGTIPDFDGDTTPDPTIFQDPWAVRIDRTTGDIFLLDGASDPLGLSSGYIKGALFRIDPASGAVTLVSEAQDYAFPYEIVERNDGKVYFGDKDATPTGAALPGVAYLVDPAAGTSVTPPAYSYDQYYSVDYIGLGLDPGDGSLYVLDQGDPLALGYLGAVYHVDPLGAPKTNADLLSSTADMTKPFALVKLPAVFPSVASISPAGCSPGSTLPVVVRGAGFEQGAGIAMSGGIVVSGVSYISATELRATITIPSNAADPSLADVRVINPYGFSSPGGNQLFGIDSNLGGAGPPPQPLGDINQDRWVDGLDLAILGYAFGTFACDPNSSAAFENRADLNDDNAIDGSDLAILAGRFGLHY